MSRLMKTNLRIVLLPFALAACAGPAKLFDSQRPPTNVQRQAILEHIRDSFFDPYSIRDAEISNSVHFEGAAIATSDVICVKANAKNRLGGYTGRKITLFYLDASGKIFNTTEEDWGTCRDSRLQYSPFPNAEHLGDKAEPIARDGLVRR